MGAAIRSRAKSGRAFQQRWLLMVLGRSLSRKKETPAGPHVKKMAGCQDLIVGKHQSAAAPLHTSRRRFDKGALNPSQEFQLAFKGF